MRIIPNTITRQLFFSLGILVVCIIFLALLSLFFLWKTKNINKVSMHIDSQRIFITQLLKTDHEFLRFETVNHNYFKTTKSTLLHERDSLVEAIRETFNDLHKTHFSNSFLSDTEFKKMEQQMQEYSQIFARLVEKINTRGFKDYGLEGKMRHYAHRLESARSTLPLNELLTLRRHEKDFLLRKETIYIDQFNTLAEELIRSLHPTDSTYHFLASYQAIFNELIQLDFEIGILPTEGLMGKLNRESEILSEQLKQLTLLSHQRAEELIRESAVIFSIICFITIVACGTLTYFTAMRLVSPLKKLSNTMGKFMINEGLNEKELEDPEGTDEISNLSQSFIKLSRKLRAQFSEIQHKSKLLEKQNSELIKLNEELDRFIYSAAHDLKSPLSSLDGLIRLAEREINNPAHAHYFRMMLDSVHKLYGFILDITDYAKNKRQKLKVEKVDLQKVVKDIVEGLQFLPGAKRIETQIQVHGTDLFTDRTRLEIILKNLISNSFHYMDAEKKHCFVNVMAEVNENQVTLQVADNGIGIDKQHIPKIFNMFYRAVEHSKGTGIGLFLVKESIKMLRGKIGVKSSLGEWTIFTIRLSNLIHGHEHVPETEAVIQEEGLVSLVGPEMQKIPEHAEKNRGGQQTDLQHISR
jgi:signal transduction histidine kinase